LTVTKENCGIMLWLLGASLITVCHIWAAMCGQWSWCALIEQSCVVSYPRMYIVSYPRAYGHWSQWHVQC